MVHIHKKEVLSTQDTLRSLIESNPHESYLVTCDRQLKGRGRRDHAWDHLGHSLALSFNLSPQGPEALTSLELGVLTCLFFKSHYDLDVYLKWPNDLMIDSSKKCGGILIQHIHAQFLCGIGINRKTSGPAPKISDKDYAFDFIELPATKTSQELGNELWLYIRENRLTPDQTREHFSRLCLHWQKEVMIKDDLISIEGQFEGIGLYGEALIKRDGQTEAVYTGSLFIL